MLSWEKLYHPMSLIGWRRQWHPIPVLLPGKTHGWRSLEGCSPWGHWGSDITERLHFHFSLSCIGEGNGNPLQCSCLENPRDREAWWAAVYGVAQSWTRLKRLSSSSMSHYFYTFLCRVLVTQPFWTSQMNSGSNQEIKEAIDTNRHSQEFLKMYSSGPDFKGRAIIK